MKMKRNISSLDLERDPSYLNLPPAQLLPTLLKRETKNQWLRRQRFRNGGRKEALVTRSMMEKKSKHYNRKRCQITINNFQIILVNTKWVTTIRWGGKRR